MPTRHKMALRVGGKLGAQLSALNCSAVYRLNMNID
jgi:hypothetical protein